jgi:hypothetical protein
MKAMAEIFFGLIKKRSQEERDNFIFYKIVDFYEETKEYILQCINTKACMNLNLASLIFDMDILFALHPIQSCYIGIECGRYFKEILSVSAAQNKQQKWEHQAIHRYGEYIMLSQNRKGNICFISQLTNQEFIMDPRDIALSENLIREFDAIQAFHIGCMAGIKMCSPVRSSLLPTSKPYLMLIK